MTRHPWTPSDLDTLAATYPDTPTSDLAKAFGRTERAIYQQARLLGLKKSAAYLASPHACRLRRGDGDDCTLIHLVRAIGSPAADVTGA